jgi:putative transposase
MASYRSLLELKIPACRAAALTGVSRRLRTGTRPPPGAVCRWCPRTSSAPLRRAETLSALSSPEFVDLAPMQVYTKLLDQEI